MAIEFVFPKSSKTFLKSKPGREELKFKPVLSDKTVNTSYERTAVSWLSLTGYTDKARSQVTELLERPQLYTSSPFFTAAFSKTPMQFN